MTWINKVDLKELPNTVFALLKKPSAFERVSLPRVDEAAEAVSKRLDVRLLKPQNVRTPEADAIRRGSWRAAGKWVERCECLRALGYPCYRAEGKLFDVHSCFPFSYKVHYVTVPVAPTKGADIKFPWFYTRAYHFARGAVLGVAPPGELFQVVRPYYGPGWYNAMEAGLRALNLIFALSLKRYVREITEQLLASLLYIPVNLEVGITTSNHLLSDLYGFVSASLVLGTAWRPLAKGAWKFLEPLAYEVNKQIDGWDYEGPPPTTSWSWRELWLRCTWRRRQTKATLRGCGLR